MRHIIRIIFVSAGCLIAGCGSKPVEEAETTAAVPVQVEAAKVDVLESTFTVTGTVMPAPGAEFTITAPENARIAEITKAEGDEVKAGDVLVRFDIPTLAAELDAKRAAVKQATVRVETFKANVTRLTNLVDRGVAAQKEVEEARREQAEAEADLAQAESAVAAATALAARATVRATFGGVVAKRWHNPGDFVEPGGGNPVLRIIDPKNLIVVAAVPVADAARVLPGHAARVIGPAGGDGEPAIVRTQPAQVDPGAATADVRVTFNGPTHLPAGTVVQVEIVAERRAKAIVIPAIAIIHDGDETFVMVAGADNKAHKRAVEVGLTSNATAEIKSGLKDGELVIVHGQDDLPDNAAITVGK